jgi:hypothetical protein
MAKKSNWKTYVELGFLAIAIALITFLCQPLWSGIVNRWLFSQEHRSKTDETVPTTEAKETVPKEQSMSFQDYFLTLDKLKDRFYERDSFLNSLNGKEISWIGFVSDVSEQYGSIFLVVQPPKFRGSIGYERAIFAFDEKFRTQLFAFKKGDKVKVVGSFKIPEAPILNGVSVDLISE